MGRRHKARLKQAVATSPSEPVLRPIEVAILSRMSAQAPFLIPLPDENATVRLAARLAYAVNEHVAAVREKGLNIRLAGNLGAGKTTFTRAFLRTLGFTGRVKSPTFELVNDYDVLGDVLLHHFDFYRFEDPSEFEDAGFRDLFGARQIVFSEWSDKAEPYLPPADIVLTLTVTDVSSRCAQLEARSAFGREIIEVFR